MPPKTDVRRALRAQRNNLSVDEQKTAARRLAGQFATTRWFHASRRIACYLAHDGEIDPADIMHRLWRRRKKVYLPVLAHSANDRLWFAPAQPGGELKPNRFGILEPAVPRAALIRAEELDLVLLPLVGFDIQGNRLGMGGGFYDRSLAFLRYRTYLKKPYLVGLGHDFQRTDKIAADPWDVHLDAVITDRAVYLIGAS